MKADGLDLLMTRTSPPIHELREPAPSDAEIDRIVSAAIRVPDHGRLAPWRFILFRGDARVTIGEKLAALAEAREGPLSEGRRNQELSRFSRAPLVIGIVSCTKDSPKIPEWEMFLSGGAAAMNLLNAVHALGYKGNWITNWYSDIPESREIFGLAPHERIVGFVHIGSHEGAVPERPRPAVDDVLSEWRAPGA
ncbi:MAG: nitroreductase [Methylobacterium mesophilicum]|nr:nitroreductase [Methylobacterium mesophilicum]